MEKEELEAYRKAGKIASEVREWSKSLIRTGAGALEIANAIEEEIKKKGAQVAFPCNVSLNEVAAHYTPTAKDTLEFKETDIVTIDLGAHIDGYIADTAYTIDLSGENGELVEASKAGLEAAIETVRAGVSVSEIGKAVHSAISDFGFKPIENLTGHELGNYHLHGGVAIPNVEVSYDLELKEGQAFAIEPFATTGRGRVIEGKQTEIYSLLQTRPTRLMEGRKVLAAAEERKGLPFAERWFPELNQFKLKMALRELTKRDALHGYPLLLEAEKGLVSQAEHTMIIEEDGCEVTTI